jgi:amino acid transporter
VTFGGKGAVYGPFAGLATALGVSWLATVLYADAIIFPAGTGLLYVGTSARISVALARNNTIPRGFARLTTRGVPVLAILFSFLLGMIVFLPFPGWQQLVGFISSATVLAYATAPLSLGALRLQEPDRPRPFRLPGGAVLAPLAFVVANEVLLFSGWAVVWKLIVAILLGVALLGISAATSPSERRPSLDWLSGAWLAPYLSGMGVISYLSSFDTKTPSSIAGLLRGPRNTLTFGWDVLAVAIFSVLVYALAIRLRLPDRQVRAYVADLAEEAETVEGELADGAPRRPSCSPTTAPSNPGERCATPNG